MSAPGVIGEYTKNVWNLSKFVSAKSSSVISV